MISAAGRDEFPARPGRACREQRLGVVPGQPVGGAELAPCLVGGGDGDQRGGTVGGKVLAEAAELGDAGHGEPGSFAVAALSLGHGRGQVRFDRRGGEQGPDDVPAALLEDAGEADLGGEGLPGAAAARMPATRPPASASSSIRSISAISMPRLEPSRA